MTHKTLASLLGFLMVASVASTASAVTRADACAQIFAAHAASKTQSRLQDILLSTSPIIAAHGKNVNMAPEHTWLNLYNSLQDGARVLEMDLQITADGQFLLVHDPTLHRVVKGYQTPQTRIESFEREHPELAEQKRTHWDYLLLDRISSLNSADIKREHLLHEPQRQTFYEFITFDEILKATDVPGEFRIPSFRFASGAGTAGDPIAHLQYPPQHYKLPHSPAFFLDLKDLNVLSRRLSKLDSWDWIKNTQSTSLLMKEARRVIGQLSKHLERHQAFDRVFVPARHPKIATLIRQIDPRIAIMMSPETAPEASTNEALIEQFRAFLPMKPEFAEIKTLSQLRDPKIREFLRSHGIKVFFDQIVQTDPAQFQGVYENDLDRLLADVISEGIDIVIQTNTPKQVVEHIKKREGR